MTSIKSKQIVLVIFIAFAALSSTAQELITASPKIENQLEGELDYTKGGLGFILRQQNGEHIRGEIDTKGVVHFSMPAFDIRALYDSINLQHYKFQSLFEMQDCEGKDIFDKTPYDDVYSQRYEPIRIEKYGITVGVLNPISHENMLNNKNFSDENLALGSKYHWFYIDRAMEYKEECKKTSASGFYNIEVEVGADMKFKKGWNFIKEELVEIQDYRKDDFRTKIPKKIHFTSISPKAKEVKWFIKQTAKDEDIQVAKKLSKFNPITKEEFDKWAPNKLGDLSVTTNEYGMPPRGRKNKNNIHLVYADESQEKEIELYVVDFCRNPGDVEMINFAYAMEYEGKEEKDIKPYITQYRESEQITQLLYKIGDRLFVEASGKNINAEDLWEYIKKLKVEKLGN